MVLVVVEVGIKNWIRLTYLVRSLRDLRMLVWIGSEGVIIIIIIIGKVGRIGRIGRRSIVLGAWRLLWMMIVSGSKARKNVRGGKIGYIKVVCLGIKVKGVPRNH